MQRLPDWEARLGAWLLTQARVPHDYAEHNCGHLGIGALAAMTGERPGAELLEYCKDRESALALVKNAGGMEALVTSELGEPLEGVLLAVKGDLVMAPLDDGDGIGICDGPVCIFLGPRGLTHLPLAACTRAWRVAFPKAAPAVEVMA